MKRVGRWTWMLLTLLLLLCGTVLAAAPERTSIELEQPIEMTFEEDGIFRYTLTAPIDGMRVQVEWLTESKDFTSLKIAGRTAYGTNGIYNLGEHGENRRTVTAAKQGNGSRATVACLSPPFRSSQTAYCYTDCFFYAGAA